MVNMWTVECLTQQNRLRQVDIRVMDKGAIGDCEASAGVKDKAERQDQEE